jgi:SAM-dependent methyltransferase
MAGVPEIDVEQIMKQIREDLSRKRSGGEGSGLSRSSTPPADGHLSTDLTTLHSSWDVYNTPFTSHRTVAGRFILFVRRILRQLLSPIFACQVDYNAANTRVTTHLKEQMDAVVREQARLREEVSATQWQALQTLGEQMEAFRREQVQLREEAVAAQGQAQQTLGEQMEAFRREQVQLREEVSATQGQAWQTLGEQMEAFRREQVQLREEIVAVQGQAQQALGEQMEAFRREQVKLREEVLVVQGQALQAFGEQVEALRQEQVQLREQALAARAQALQIGLEQSEPLQAMRERISRAERKLRRILHSTWKEDHRDGEKPEAKRRAIRESFEPAFDYLGFEERFRGSEEAIKERQRPYVDYFKRAGTVLDIGCGRGEFLELLREAGVDIVEANAFTYLESLPDDSLQGIFSSQMIEHLDSGQIVDLVRLSHHKLHPSGVLILETPNPRCLTVFAESFYLDLSHIRLVHPEAAKFLLESTGFQHVELKFSAPVEHSRRIPPLPPQALPEGALDDFNRGVERLNDLLYGFQDYAVIGVKVGVLP